MIYHELQPGTLIDNRYLIKQCVGSGSFGEVWLADDTIVGLSVAVKVYIQLNQQGQEQFMEEYRVAQGLQHQNLLIPTYLGIYDQRPFLVMKYCSEGAVEKIVGEMPEEQIWNFIYDVASGLAYLHDQKTPVIHQDLKPANILIDEREHFLITDFGESCKLKSTMRKQSKREQLSGGSPAYMGPERFLSQPLSVMASDIWSLGVCIYECATGDLPFWGQGGSMLNNGAQLPCLDNSKFSTELNALMQACLAKDTWDRPTAKFIVDYVSEYRKNKHINYEKWKKINFHNGSLVPKPKPRYRFNIMKTLQIALVAVIAVLSGLIIYKSFIYKNENEKSITERYENLKSICSLKIEEGNVIMYENLIVAARYLDSLKLYNDSYAFIDDTSEYLQLKREWQLKADEASAKWLAQAKGKYNETGDLTDYIKELGIAFQLNGSEEARQQLSRIGIMKTAGAFIFVDKVVYAGIISIYYTGIQNINDVEISYTYGTNHGEVSVDIKKGHGSFTIPVVAAPKSQSQEISLSNNGIVFYKGVCQVSE